MPLRWRKGRQDGKGSRCLKGHGYGLNAVSLQNAHVEILSPNMMVLAGGALGND